jgi:hypothetical protein
MFIYNVLMPSAGSGRNRSTAAFVSITFWAIRRALRRLPVFRHTGRFPVGHPLQRLFHHARNGGKADAALEKRPTAISSAAFRIQEAEPPWLNDS